MDKWFYADRAIRQTSFRRPAYRGGRSGTSFQCAVLHNQDGAAGAALFTIFNVLFRMPEASAPDMASADFDPLSPALPVWLNL